MTLPVLASPLPGPIHQKGWSRPTGNTDFEVSSTLADHIASKRGLGTDFWNGQCGAPVRLMLAGVCYQKYIQPIHNPPQIGDGARIARFRHPDGSNSGYAHLGAFGDIVVGGSYLQGHIVGSLGKSGASACHLHCHYQDAAGVHHEVYDLLAKGGDMLGIVTATLLEGGPRQFTIPAGTILSGYDPARPGGPIVTQAWPTSSSAPADARVAVAWPGTAAPPVPNGSPFLRCTAGVYAGLLVLERLVQLAPAPPPPAPDCSAAVKAATDQLNARIAAIKAKVAAGASDIADD